ncbi:MAG: hypothetical protein N2170_06580 [Bacteroidia bacterium]|nr:hypothetical protein [Bacteroidia bacterium]
MCAARLYAAVRRSSSWRKKIISVWLVGMGLGGYACKSRTTSMQELTSEGLRVEWRGVDLRVWSEALPGGVGEQVCAQFLRAPHAIQLQRIAFTGATPQAGAREIGATVKSYLSSECGGTPAWTRRCFSTECVERAVLDFHRQFPDAGCATISWSRQAGGGGTLPEWGEALAKLPLGKGERAVAHLIQRDGKWYAHTVEVGVSPTHMFGPVERVPALWLVSTEYPLLSERRDDSQPFGEGQSPLVEGREGEVEYLTTQVLEGAKLTGDVREVYLLYYPNSRGR